MLTLSRFISTGFSLSLTHGNKSLPFLQGIVAAVRELGGRFLALDDRTDTYSDIGDKRATEKSSQALREGQAQTKKQIYHDEEAGLVQPKSPNQLKEQSESVYFGYSFQVLDALYKEHADKSTSHAPVVPATVPSSVTAITNNDAMAMALDQFPVVPPIQEKTTYIDSSLPVAGVGAGGIGARPSERFTNMSLSSFLSFGSIHELLESARDEHNLPAVEWMGARGTMMSYSGNEVRALIRTSESLLAQIENVAFEVMNERVSELRCTDICKDVGAKVGGDGDPLPRDGTFYSRTSLMDASMMTIDRDDMSFLDGKLTFSEFKEQQERPPVDDVELLHGMSVNPGQRA